MGVDFESLSLSELTALQSELGAVMIRRFQRSCALAFSDVVGSTEYFANHGNIAGRALQQRHLDLLKEVLPAADGRIVDTAGDGAFLCFPAVEPAVKAFVLLANAIERHNQKFAAEHKLTTRVGIHFGPVLTDGTAVSGDAVNFCARLGATGNPGEIRISANAYRELDPDQRGRCRPLPKVTVKGFAEPVEVMLVDWRDRSAQLSHVLIFETKERLALPDQDIITFGRLDEDHRAGIRANDIVLSHPDAEVAETISRWHFELRRRGDQFVCRAVSNGSTVVDDVPVPKGSEAPVKPGTIVKVADALSLLFVQEDGALSARMKSTKLR